jgi:hypothetical protein
MSARWPECWSVAKTMHVIARALGLVLSGDLGYVGAGAAVAIHPRDMAALSYAVMHKLASLKCRAGSRQLSAYDMTCLVGRGLSRR